MRGLPLLGLGAFAVGTDAYVMAGLLPGIGGDLGVSVSAAGQTVTAFTLCYALAAPLLSVALARLGTRAAVLTALTVFTAANAGSALAGSYGTLLALRAAAGVGAGLFTPTAAAAAAALAPPERRGRALGLVLTGMSGGTVVGVPLGLLLADACGWRATLWMVAAAGAAVCLGVALRLPAVPSGAVPSLRGRFRGLAEPGVASVVAVTFTQTVASLGLYTYLEPVLRRTAHPGGPALCLWVWGVGGVCGSLLAGQLTDRVRRPALVSGTLLGLLGIALALLPWTGALPGLTLLPLAAWGAVGWAFVVPQQYRLLSLESPGAAGGAAVALNSSATYLGGATGSALGGVALAAGLGARWLPAAAAAVAFTGVLLHITSVRLPVLRDRRSPDQLLEGKSL